ncbi:MAG: class I SAM-dependent methyltransferase [Phycisphaeraceae bacterium]
MSEKPPDTYLDPYREAVGDHGSDFHVTLWANRRTQLRRFEVFAEMLPLRGKRILDAGCSRGDLAAYLLEAGIEYGRYIGVDGLPEVIEYARQRGLPRSEFHAGDFLADRKLLARGKPQVVAISGSLNTMPLETAKKVLESAWDATREALIFNFLSDRAGERATPQTHPARRFDTMGLIDWALKHTWAVRFRQDYFHHGHDATILMEKV